MSTPTIPENIEDLAVRFATEEAERAAYARSPKGRKAIVRQLRAEAGAKGMEVKEYIEALTRDPEGVKPPEGTAPTSAFWSYGIEHPDVPANSWNQHFLDNRYIAEAWARTQNAQSPGSAQTLETTEGGRRLNAMYLWEPEVLKALGGAEKGFTEDWTRECWGTISETYAAEAKGPVVAFAQYADTRSILYKRELPTLHANPDVGLDHINFAYEAPQTWPEQTRTEVGTDAARAQLQYNDPTAAHYIDPQTYPDQDPVERRAGLESEFASVANERAERAAAKKAGRATNPSAEQTEEQATDRPTEQTEQTEQTAEETTEAEAPATVGAKEQKAPAPSASVPLWQLGFTPRPVALETGSSGAAPDSKAPPAPGLEHQSTRAELG
ncbi:hypothetical protein AQI95_02055 [Streptomyces yokosukanensis]|uniref:Uncharacterized protein n=1 Tax=Streptomyces yokosukanensis TaxID=67386 RepID=A0A101PFI8_9ACTN|nr:hypothetical protein [Streptomyces yokosukanensis]KUN10517.1 hypothetical protein AQI95_02055 [Streptomyces yokosukanensis]